MKAQDPNASIVELVAFALGNLRSELVLVGGCAVGMLITDRARPAVRQTIDVDLIAEVASLCDYYHELSPRLRGCGFVESGDHICRWHKGDLMIDVMPFSDVVLGHSVNRWYGAAVRDARKHLLPSGLEILLVAAPVFLATKLEAFHDRGNCNYQAHDMEDIVNLVDGRPELAAEVDMSAADVRAYIREEFDDLLADVTFTEQLPMHLSTDAASQARVPILIERLRRLAGL